MCKQFKEQLKAIFDNKVSSDSNYDIKYGTIRFEFKVQDGVITHLTKEIKETDRITNNNN